MAGTMSKTGCFLAAAVLLGGLAFAPPAPGSAAPPHGLQADSQICVPEPDAFTQTLIADLGASGFQVSQGCAELYIQQDCLRPYLPDAEELLPRPTPRPHMCYRS